MPLFFDKLTPRGPDFGGMRVRMPGFLGPKKMRRERERERERVKENRDNEGLWRVCEIEVLERGFCTCQVATFVDDRAYLVCCVVSSTSRILIGIRVHRRHETETRLAMEIRLEMTRKFLNLRVLPDCILFRGNT